MAALLLLLACAGEGDDSMTTTAARAVPAEILGWKASDSVERYDRESIFDYINGAGEVYRSYAFDEVTVYRFTKPEAPQISAEVFDMGSPQDAYGVFSFTRESEESGIGGGFERRGGVICFWQDRYFVCVVADQSTDESQGAITELARTIAERLPPTTTVPRLVELLPAEGRLQHSERFFHIHPSLNYHYFLAEQNVLKLSRSTNAVLATYKPGHTHLLGIEYPTISEAGEGYRGFIDSFLPEAAATGMARVDADKWVRAINLERYVIICLDAASAEGATVLTESMKESLIKANLVTGN
jgi:hypothetical protein